MADRADDLDGGAPAPSRVLAALDGYQRRHRRAGFPLAVIYKFADDQGPYLAALITYYGFLSLFPSLLLLVTVLGFVLQDDPDIQAKVLDSALVQFPVIGGQLRENVESLRGNGLALVVGLVGTIYGSLGAAGATQNAFNRAWAVPRNRRPNPFASRLRSLMLLPLLPIALIATTLLAGASTGAGAYGADLGALVKVVATLGGLALNIALFLVVFRLLTSHDVPARDLRVGALVAAVGWWLAQILGTYLVTHVLRGSEEAYGVFGLVLGLMAWIYLLAVITVFAVEINVVAVRRLWPRALLTPFTDRVELTPADERAYTAYAGAERHKGFEVVDVSFRPPDDGEG